MIQAKTAPSVRPLDILYVGMLPPHPGGSGISWSQVLGGLARLGHAVRALSPITRAALDGGDAFADAHPELAVTRFLVPHFYTGPNVPASPEYRALEREQIESKMGALIEERRPDVVVSGRETFAMHVPDLAERHSLPCLQGVRGNTAIAILNGTYPRDLTLELLAAFRKVSLLVSVARHMADGLHSLGLGGVRVIPNSVDLAQFSSRSPEPALRREIGLAADDVVAVHASNLKAAKRPMDLVSSAVPALRGNSKLAYVVVGDGAHRSEMEAACRELGIAGRFRFVGWVDYARMPAFFGLADFVVMPSQTEGLSRVYLETQASGKALLASDIPAAREVIRDGETGLLFRVGDVDDLAEKTLRLAGDRALRERIGAKARERVRAHSLTEIAAAYASTLEECVQRGAGILDATG
jgi:glycosyltransferase involved in cell wall biosynthesis